MTSLLEAVRRYTETHDAGGAYAHTPMPGLGMVRAIQPSELVRAISRPLICLVLQGSKTVTMGSQTFRFSAGESLLITADVPIVSQIVQASAARPYFALAIELDLAVIADLVPQMEAAGSSANDLSPIRVDATETETAEAALRLIRLLDNPAQAAVLQASVLRELHYWLLAGRHGAAIRRLGWPGGHAGQVADVVALLRRDFARTLSVEDMARTAGMSPSSFHRHFRAATSLSPLQFQKQLRLIEARRLMLAEGAGASTAAFAVGYESVSQFTREYGRMFGAPPVRDAAAMRGRVMAA